MIKLCIFDLDGTVLNTLNTIAYYGNQALVKHGIEAIDTKSYKYLVGNGMANLIKNMLNFRGCYSDGLFTSVLATYDKAYSADVLYKTTVYDGILPMLEELKNEGVSLAIVSNKQDPVTQMVIREVFGDSVFSYVTGQKAGGPLKPDPSAVLEIVSKEGVSLNQCLYVGDTSTDMKTGKNAGIFTVGVLWGFRDEKELLESGADAIIDHPSRLLDIVNSKR